MQSTITRDDLNAVINRLKANGVPEPFSFICSPKYQKVVARHIKTINFIKRLKSVTWKNATN